MKILIATENAGKIESAKRAFEKYFENVEVTGIKICSDVSEQPVNEETKKGATNRLLNLKKHCEEKKRKADYYVSIETGIVDLYGTWFNMNIAAISDNTNKISYGVSSSFPIPEKYIPMIKEKSIGYLFNELFGVDQERHTKGGGIEGLSHNQVSRIDLGESAFIMALTEWINESWTDECC